MNPLHDPDLAPHRSAVVREILPSASRHLALALVHVPGPEHEIEPQPYHRICFNIGPSYAAQASAPGLFKDLSCARHALMIIPPDVRLLHTARTPRPAGQRSRPARLATFRISRELFAESAMAAGLPSRDAEIGHKIVPADEILRLLAQTLYADLRSGQADGPVASERSAVALVCRLLLREQAGRAAVPQPVRRVQDHISAHLAAPLTLEQLAEVAGMSLFHFCRVFREQVGVTPHQYILAGRLETARRLLWSDSGMSVLDIALACGFGSSSHFSAQFKRHTGATPLQWKRSH